ncbi:hypothetical protein K435DRAFT_803437 [Dendrothele bispora CBS 962.96]|uniref:Uncharacterized protein n=1 Tax=Dendrothele bispora (strain CBS 962.96) TaxID=1314807 RepID=A0A4S8LI94_DENBC|nr:hypothetical protein K435DRAFT_803437 [Dendrothele bispora CBS 962.96]
MADNYEFSSTPNELVDQLWEMAVPEREVTSFWEWVESGEDPMNPWYENKNYSITLQKLIDKSDRVELERFELPIPPQGRAQGKEWLYRELSQSFSWGEQISHKYLDALRAVFLVRDDIGEYLMWNSPPAHSDAFPPNLDELAWAAEQASRTRDGSLPRPTFSGVEVETRRMVVFDRCKAVHTKLSASRRKIQEIGRARLALSEQDNGKLREMLLTTGQAENSRRILLQSQYEELQAAAQNLLFLTAVSIVHAR